eukprot:1161667-Pelagomonas_calceolata.AAC.8
MELCIARKSDGNWLTVSSLAKCIPTNSCNVFFEDGIPGIFPGAQQACFISLTLQIKKEDREFVMHCLVPGSYR